MNTLIHKRTTILCPCTSPRCLCIVTLISIPSHMDGPVRKLSKTTCFQSLSHLLNSYIKTILMARRYFHTLFLRTFDDLCSILHTHSHWFFNNKINPVIDAIQCNFCVKTTFCSNTYQLNLIFFNHFLVICISLNACIILKIMLCQQFFHMFRNHITHSYKFQIVI